MKPWRMRQVRTMAARATTRRKLERLYEEVYGAHVGSTVSDERVRASIIEAVDELLERKER